MSASTGFSEGFLWGAATSAYQIEGSPLADGAGPSVWHRFSHTPGLVSGSETGDVSCDHYRLWREDVALMRELGLGAYRFSVSWSRVLPDGRGAVNEKGLDFYRRLVDALAEAGITPLATLFHWDLPAALDDRGGWLNRDVAAWFADYTRIVVRALDDRVPLWATLNEPWVVADGGYLHGLLAPGHRSLFEAPIAANNLLRAHTAGVTAYRSEGKNRIGLVVNLEPKHRASESAEDVAAARRADAYVNRFFLDPVFLGRYPDEMRGLFGEAWPDAADRDAPGLKSPGDFLGINYYSRNVVCRADDVLPFRFARVRQEGAPHTAMDWEIWPDGLRETLAAVTERYGRFPLYVTENGAAFDEPASAGAGDLADPLRVAYLRDHLRAARTAIREGVDLRGYFAWSLLDNFEWSHGTSKLFGLVHVDFATQKRTPKASARFLSDVARTHGASLGPD